jgi:hypothetical protein
MHAYKDAIRRTGGAYILYPGTEIKEYSGFHELIPGLGAFAVNPSDEGIGLENISDFIDRVLESILDRSSQREQMASKIYNIHKKPKSEKLLEAFPEVINGEKVLPDEDYVLVGYYKSKEHLEWILKNKLYNFRTGTGVHERNGSIEMNTDNIGAKFIVLHGYEDMPTSKIFSLSKKGPKIYLGSDLTNLNYPKVNGSLYLVFELVEDLCFEFKNVKFDLSIIPGYINAKTKFGPVSCTLTELFNSKIEK